jgi:hypothetical protein
MVATALPQGVARASLTAVGTVGLVWSVLQLQHGVLEVPMHWWSTLAALPLAAGVLLLGWLVPLGWWRARPG